MIIGICEDHATIRAELRLEIEKQEMGIPFQIYDFASGEALLASQLQFDLVFLDIELNGGITGLEVAQQLQDQQPDMILVFISGYTKYISSALHLHTFQFLLKPLDRQLFQEEFHRCIAHYRASHDMFHVLQNGESIDIQMKDIVYIESDKRKLLIHDRWGKLYEMYGKISEQEQLLAVHHFVRVHKSFLVNCRYIKKMKDEALWLAGPSKNELIELPISRRCREHVREQYHAYFLGV